MKVYEGLVYLRLEGAGGDSVIATLDKKACEGRVWQHSLNLRPRQFPSPRPVLYLWLGVRFRLEKQSTVGVEALFSQS